MTCREASPLLPLFFDGELDPRQMRAVAMHSTRCENCERELRQLERLQELVSTTIYNAVDEIDFSEFPAGVAARLGPVHRPWWKRARRRWEDQELPWPQLVPAFAAAAAVAILALFLFTRAPQPLNSQPGASQVATVDNTTSIDSLDADVDSVAVLNDPETSTTVVWVSDDAASSEATP
jgi:anti-sigma factor RsiW